MKINIQQRELKNGTRSLVLAYYQGGTKRYEFLKLYLVPEKTRIDKQLNQNTLELAEKIRARRILEAQNTAYGFTTNSNFRRSFIKFFEKQTEDRFNSGVNHQNWDSTLKHVKTFTKGELTMEMVTEAWMIKFREYLEKNLSPNSANSYFGILKHCIHDAIRDGYIANTAATRVKSPQGEESNREFLTIEEIRILAKSECHDNRIKKAFLFGCLTGLRISDLQTITWGQLNKNSTEGYEITLTMKKTKTKITIPVNQEAIDLIGERGNASERIFSGLKYSAHVNKILSHWVLINGIQKHITWHNARHTYGTLLLSSGVDIYTVCKMMGHKDVKTTQVYVKVLDESKRKAVDLLPSITLPE